MNLINNNNTNKALIVSITPYFLEKGNVWIQENTQELLSASKAQSFFEDNIIFIEQGQSYNFSGFLRKLDEMGYERVFKVSEPGEFSQKGGIVDVFPINMNSSARFDFLGDEIESITLLDTKIEDEGKSREILKKRLKSQKLFSDLKGLKPGDYLVHLDHGVAQFIGIENNYYVLQYALGDKLYVPLGLERKLSRYVGFVDPKISRLGSSLWQKTKKKIKEETEKLARELLEIYAKREVATRLPYLQEDEIDIQLKNTFPYEETPDQIQAIDQINHDLEKEEPMDRLVCGDVGFGKTEVALRAMIKVVKSGYQVALLCATTILASQHFQNFKARIENLAIKIALLSRIQSEKEQKEIAVDLKS